jgi:WhiB family redox-sensing transcriptional regulator
VTRIYAVGLGSDPDEVFSFEELLRRPAWHADAACQERRDLDWFPVRFDVTAQRAVCGSCLVRDECLAWALDQSDTLEGVWSGTTKGQRRAMRKARRSSAA